MKLNSSLRSFVASSSSDLYIHISQRPTDSLPLCVHLLLRHLPSRTTSRVHVQLRFPTLQLLLLLSLPTTLHPLPAHRRIPHPTLHRALSNHHQPASSSLPRSSHNFSTTSDRRFLSIPHQPLLRLGPHPSLPWNRLLLDIPLTSSCRLGSRRNSFPEEKNVRRVWDAAAREEERVWLWEGRVEVRIRRRRRRRICFEFITVIKSSTNIDTSRSSRGSRRRRIREALKSGLQRDSSLPHLLHQPNLSFLPRSSNPTRNSSRPSSSTQQPTTTTLLLPTVSLPARRKSILASLLPSLLPRPSNSRRVHQPSTHTLPFLPTFQRQRFLTLSNLATPVSLPVGLRGRSGRGGSGRGRDDEGVFGG